MKKCLYSGHRIIDWQDHAAYSYGPPQDGCVSIEVSDDQWDNRDTYRSVQGGVLSTLEPPPLAVLSSREVLELAKNQLRPTRNSILAEVVQIALVSRDQGNNALADEVLTPETGLRDRLRDITQDPALNSAQTSAEMENAVLNYYRTLVTGVSPELRQAFRGLQI